MSSTSIPEPWRSFLLEIDGYVTHDHYFHCLGGFVVTHLYGSVRTTSDIDFLTLVQGNDELINYAGIGSPLYKRFGLYLDPVGVANVPEDYEARLIEMYPGAFEHLRLYALDPYDIALGVPATAGDASSHIRSCGLAPSKANAIAKTLNISRPRSPSI